MARDVAELGIEPVATGADGGPGFHGDDLDALAACEHVVERHHLAVDLRAATAVAEARMHGVGEIDRSRASRQVDYLALRREHVDRVSEKTRLELLQPFAGIGDRILPVEHLPEPADLLLVAGIA